MMRFVHTVPTVLSQRTRDEVTERSSEKLFAKYGTCSELARADTGDIEELIRDVGFYRTKAPRVKEIARMIDNDFKGKVPADLETLLLLPGVGRKTANCVLVYGFGQEICRPIGPKCSLCPVFDLCPGRKNRYKI